MDKEEIIKLAAKVGNIEEEILKINIQNYNLSILLQNIKNQLLNSVDDE